MIEASSSTLPPLPRVLIVDDEPVHVKALCDVLPQHGYEAIGVTNAAAALELLQAAKCDLLLTDLMMPEVDGIGLLRSAQTLDPDLVGVIMTGQGTIETAVRAMKSGALDYVLKPLRLSLTLPVLERALSVRALRRANKDLERHVLERTTQLEIANKDLEDANRALAMANEELEAFSYSVSHDLRAPFRHISGFAELLLSDEKPRLSERGQDYLLRISQSAQFAGQLVDSLLNFSKIARTKLDMRPVAMSDLVKEVWHDVVVEELNGREFDFNCVPLPTVDIDVQLMRQAWRNLLSNAAKYTKNRPVGKVQVTGWRDHHQFIFSVRDNGVGFDNRYANKLFGVFQRLHRMEDFEGTGIGLANVRRIVTRHGGQTWAEGRLNEGATFFFSLPIPEPHTAS